MESHFPFNLPTPTIWYVLLYVVTLFLHLVFMSYVFGGSIMLGVAGCRGLLGRRAQPSAWAAATTILKDWMPFALSAAITAGIAPLLFVQILYQQEFYTANLLSFHRWMAILPVLIVAFYLLYLLKAHRMEGRTVLQGIVAIVVMACILFVAWSWVENHLLSMDKVAWPVQYESGSMFYANPAILPRLGLWIAGTLSMASLLLGWQLRVGASGVEPDVAARAARPLAVTGLISLAVAAVAGWQVIPAAATSATNSGTSDHVTWLAVAGIGAAVWSIGWLAILKAKATPRFALVIGSVGSVVFWFGILVAREAVRWSVLGTASNVARHQRVGSLAGFVVFLTFAALGVGSIAWVVRAVSQAQRKNRAT